MTTLKIYKTHPDVILPTFATKQSACFDIAMQFHGKNSYKGYDSCNKEFTRNHGNGKVHITAGDRVLVPTGLILDIPEGYSVRLHPRSGLSLKQGLVLANSEGVIDADYVEEVFVLIHNISENGIWINNGDRIAQAELVKVEEYVIEETKDRPNEKTERSGGMGSTGLTSKPAKKPKAA